jgi:SAM-dependent methyltransferase
MKSQTKSEESAPVCPIKLRDEEQVVPWIAEITGRAESTIRDCLRREFKRPGVNVVREFAEISLEPYVWSEELVRFYEQTDAFLYELVVWNCNSLKRRMRSYITKYLAQYKGSSRNVLCIGDGLGIDSLYLAQNCQKVTYFELEGFSHRFATRIFSLADADIKVVSKPQHIPVESFDAVVCLDVLEHVRDVPAFLKQLTAYLRPGGIFIVHAPFYMIHPSNPTHLKANRKYSGKLDLYYQCGLKLVNGRFFWNPLIFEKVSDDTNRRKPQRSALGMFSLKLGGWYLSIGRFTVLPFLWIVFYRKKRNKPFNKK